MTRSNLPEEKTNDALSANDAHRAYSCRWVDFAHIVKARGEWKLFHVTWHARRDAQPQTA